jgi:hypothetical protein
MAELADAADLKTVRHTDIWRRLMEVADRLVRSPKTAALPSKYGLAADFRRRRSPDPIEAEHLVRTMASGRVGAQRRW